MDVIGERAGAEIVGWSEPRAAVPRIASRSLDGRRIVPALPASVAAMLLAHRIELELDVCDLFDLQLRGEAPPVIDARVHRSFRAGHIPGAIHLPAEDVTRGALLALPAAPFIVIYGADAMRLDGVRTAQAAAELGFSVKLLTGGFAAWQEQGFPVDLPGRTEGRMAAL